MGTPRAGVVVHPLWTCRLEVRVYRCWRVGWDYDGQGYDVLVLGCRQGSLFSGQPDTIESRQKIRTHQKVGHHQARRKARTLSHATEGR